MLRPLDAGELCGFLASHRLLFGGAPGGRKGTVVAVFSARLDEAGKDGRPYVVVAGGVALLQQWDRLESKWDHLMRWRRIPIFHDSEFQDGDGPYRGWSEIKRRRFARAQEKIISEHTAFTVAVGVERKVHAEIKKSMKGIRSFKADSDYGLCFRMIRFLVCGEVAKYFPTAKVQFLIESGPDAADAGVIYEEVRKTAGAKYRPAQLAEMLAGFAHAPKGVFRSLEAADYLAGRSMRDLERGQFNATYREDQISFLMTEEFLRKRWYEGMLKERERRQAYGRRKPKPSS
jgi:hypothetical protein